MEQSKAPLTAEAYAKKIFEVCFYKQPPDKRTVLDVITALIKEHTTTELASLRQEKSDAVDKESVMNDIEALQEKVDKMGFKGQNEYDLHLRQEIADYILTTKNKK